MKNFLILAFLGMSLWMFSCVEHTSKSTLTADSILNQTAVAQSFGLTDDYTNTGDSTPITFQAVQKAVSSADSLSGLIADYKHIESDQNGVCDTCVTGFVSVLIEHRTVSKKLSDEIAEMNRNLEKVKAYNSEAFGLVNVFQRQSLELENIVSLRANLIQDNQKQVAELRKGKSELTASKALLEKVR